MRDWLLLLAAFLCFVVAAVELWRGTPVLGRTPWVPLGWALFVLMFLWNAWP